MLQRSLTVLACLLAVALARPARADLFVKIPGIPGDATLAGHKDEIQVFSLSFGGGQIVPKSGAKACASPRKTQVLPIIVTKLGDIASPKLFMAAAQGTVFPDVTITITNSSFQDIISHDLQNAFISSYSASSGGDRPSESLALTFTSLGFTNVDGTTPETVIWNFCGTGS